jgi:hypothetical protein
MYLSRDKELLLLLSQVQPDNAALHRAQSLITPPLIWDNFITLASHHGTAPIVFKNLLKLKKIPQEIITRFKNIYNHSLRSNILMVNELDRIINNLSKNYIDVISLKGATASETIFGDIGLYPSGDLDILIRIEDIDRTRKVLESMDYILNDKGFDEYREFFLRELYHINLSNGSFTIEPHWNLFLRYFTAPPEFWWDESMVVPSGGKQYRFLSPEKNILYTAFRLFSKGFTRLRFLVMVAEVVRYYHETTNWEKLFAYAKEYKFENTLRLTLKLCHELLGAPVPYQYTEIKNLRVNALYRRAGEMVFVEEDSHPLNKALFAFLRDDVTGTVSVLLRRLFPSMGEVVSRYRLQEGSRKAKLYYLFNPLFLLLRRHQK